METQQLRNYVFLTLAEYRQSFVTFVTKTQLMTSNYDRIAAEGKLRCCNNLAKLNLEELLWWDIESQ